MSAEQPNPYNQLPTDNEEVVKYQPVFLARGGDHLVYEAAGHPEVVIKVSTFKIKDILSDNVERGLPLDGLSDEMRTSLEKEVAGKNTQIRQYRKYFGIEHTLSERRYLMKVPVTKELLQAVFHDDWKGRSVPEDTDPTLEVWSAVIIQKKAPEIIDPNHLGLYFGGFVEERTNKPDLDEYQRVNEVFIDGSALKQEDLGLFFKVQDNPDTHALADLILKSKEDSKLKEVVQDFVRTGMNFAKDTGNILALAGQDNVIVYPKEGGWNYVLVDAIPVYNEPVLTLAREAKERSKNGEVLSEKDNAYTLRAENFVRTMNGLAAAVELNERLTF